MRLKKRTHYILLLVTLFIACGCVFLIPHVNVNSDMTKYLPDSSPMKKGLGVLREEFGPTEMNMAGVKVMFKDPDPEHISEFSERLAAMPYVDGVISCRTDSVSQYTLFELSVSPNVDQKALGRKIKDETGRKNVVVETSQDGSTPPVYVIILAFSLVVVILLLMAGSWLDPVIILISVGLAIAVNIGTNALLPSVSITTNYIAAILQLVLSMDFSIILINRYRQEEGTFVSSLQAVNVAVGRAVPSVCSSAFTTIVGLLMLVFMKLKIGMDMGVVLAKGVLCSLICTFTVLPSLILLLDKALDKTTKKVYMIRTDRLAGFCLRYKTVISVSFVILFALSFYFHEKTPISFSTKGESVIEKYFPSDNAVVLLYDNNDENKILSLSDSILSCPSVKTVLSYPTLLEKPLTAGELYNTAKSSGQFNSPLLTPEVIRLVYYMKHGEAENLKLNLQEIAGFITGTCLESPLLKGRLDKETQEKIELLTDLTRMGEAGVKQEPPVVEQEPRAVEPKPEPEESVEPVAPQMPVIPEVPAPPPAPAPAASETVTNRISVVDFVPRLHAYSPNAVTESMLAFCDTSIIHKPLTDGEMSAVIGSTPYQTGMVYMLYKAKNKKITPYEYVHFLCDDLFNRKTVSSMIKPDEKHALRIRKDLMDLAVGNTVLEPAEVAALMARFDLDYVDEVLVKELYRGADLPNRSTDLPVRVEKNGSGDPFSEKNGPGGPFSEKNGPGGPFPEKNGPGNEVRRATRSVGSQYPVSYRSTDLPVRVENRTTDPILLRAFSAAEIADLMEETGQSAQTPLVTMLYNYYGSVNLYNESWTMSLAEFMDFISRIEFLDDTMQKTISDAREMMDEGIGKLKSGKHSLAVIITSLPDESPQTYAAVDKLQSLCKAALQAPHYLIGESVMLNEMHHSFKKEIKLITWLTIIAIWLIIMIGLRSLFSPTVLVMTVMTAVFVNVIFSGIINGSMLYIAYLITQSMLMGATIDYGILFANYYKEKRRSMPVDQAVKEAYKGAIPTISTSGLIMIIATSIMAVFTDDAAISAILGSLSIGSIMAVVLILTVIPSMLAVMDRGKKLPGK